MKKPSRFLKSVGFKITIVFFYKPDPPLLDAMYRDQTFGTKSSEMAIGTNRNSLNETSLLRYRDYMGRFNPNVSYNRFGEEEFLQSYGLLKMAVVPMVVCCFWVKGRSSNNISPISDPRSLTRKRKYHWKSGAVRLWCCAKSSRVCYE